MLATTPKELEKLRGPVMDNARRCGVYSCRLLTREEVFALEPHVTEAVVGGLLVPEEWRVDPWVFPVTLLAEAATVSNVHVTCGARVTGAVKEGSKWIIADALGRFFHAATLINCAGQHADAVQRLIQHTERPPPPPFEMFPRLGRFLVFESDASALLRHTLLPIPTEKTKGVILFPTVHQRLVVGPTAEDPDEPRHSQAEVRRSLRAAAELFIPALQSIDVADEFAGSRPAIRGRSDYVLYCSDSKSLVCIAGVRSTGLTSSIALGEWVVQQLLWNAPGLETTMDRHAVEAAARRMLASGAVSVKHRHPIAASGWLISKL
jgi:glycerol-3-phosphate dehydrogenase